MRTKSVTLIVAILLAGAALTLVPGAEAQGKPKPQVTVTLGTPSGQIKPLQSGVTIQGTVKAIVEQTVQSSITGVQVTYTVTNQPSWATVTFSPSTDILTFPPPSGASGTAEASRQFTITVYASGDAPAFTPAPLEITAVTSSTTSVDTASGKGLASIEADYFSLLDVALGERIRIERPQVAANFPLTITNLGNANTRVSFELVEATNGLQVPPPSSQVLQSKQAGGTQNSATIPITVQTPYKNGYMNQPGTVTMKILSSYALDPKKKGPDEQVSILLTTKGFYVPGLEIPLLIGLLGVSAVVLRRRT